MLIGLAGGIPFQYSKSITGQIAALFAQGERGVHFDPSDLTTLFQDNAGTIPVTAVGQPVGLMLDKSKGLVLGPELVTNGNFADATGWSAPIAGASITGGVLAFDGATSIAVGATITSETLAATVVGRTYKLTYQIVSDTTLPISITFAGTGTTARSTAGTYTEYVTAANTTGSLLLIARTTAGARTGSVDNISVHELPGYHATQATSTARPILGRHPITGRRNLLTYTEDFGNAVWSASAVTITSGISDPFGGTSAFRVVNTNNLNSVYTFVTSSVVAGIPVTFSFYAKSNGGTKNYIGIWDRTGVGSATVSRDFTSEINANTFTKISVTITPGAGASSIYCYLTRDQALGTVDVIVADPQLELGTTPTAYQKVVSTYDCTEAGVNDAYYLKFDGVDDFMVTPSIDFSGTDKMSVFAGVRKLSDAAVGMVAELSTNGYNTLGGFTLTAPQAVGGAGYGHESRFSGTVSAGAYASTGYASPHTSVLAASGNSADAVQLVLRVNGVQKATGTGGGIGNYGNYPLYIGMRAGTTLPFNGQLYSLVVRGALSDSSQISTGEVYCNSKTGAY